MDTATASPEALAVIYHELDLMQTGSCATSEYSTFRIGDDAYTERTGTLEMGAGWAEARLFYATFAATLRWELSAQPRLVLRVDTDRPVVTTLPATAAARVLSRTPAERIRLKGFSPYSQGNAAEEVPALRFCWQRELRLEFQSAPAA